jgi:hypothetical protein
MLHQEIVTPTQRAAKDVRAKLLALKAKPKPNVIPITAHEAPQAAPVFDRTLVPQPAERPPEPEPCDVPRVTIGDIIAEVSTFYDVSKMDILSQRRQAAIVRPRQIVMYLARHMTPHSLPQIGRFLGGRDHTTVLHGTAKITKLVAENEGLASELSALKPRIIERRLMAFHRAMEAAE